MSKYEYERHGGLMMREPINEHTFECFKMTMLSVFLIPFGALIGIAIGVARHADDSNPHGLDKYAGYGALVGMLSTFACFMYLTAAAFKTDHSGANERTSPPSGSTDEATIDDGCWSKCTRGLRNLPSLFRGGPRVVSDVREERYPTEATENQDQSLLRQEP